MGVNRGLRPGKHNHTNSADGGKLTSLTITLSSAVSGGNSPGLRVENAATTGYLTLEANDSGGAAVPRIVYGNGGAFPRFRITNDQGRTPFDANGGIINFQSYLDGTSLPGGFTFDNAFTVTSYTWPFIKITNNGTEIFRVTRQGVGEPNARFATTAQFDATTNTTLATVTGLSGNVGAGKVYQFVADLYVDADVTGGFKFAIAGTATATAIIYEIMFLDNATGLYTISARQTALGGTSGAAGPTGGYCRIVGTITVNAAGTLLVQFAQNASSGTSSVLRGSSFWVRDFN